MCRIGACLRVRVCAEMKERFLALIALLRDPPAPAGGGAAAAPAAEAPAGMCEALCAMQTASYYAPRTYRPRAPHGRAAYASESPSDIGALYAFLR
jgi:hypothetical protein